jgi:hypothetical protein
MKLNVLILVLLIFLTTCKKDKFLVNYIPSSTEIEYKITLSNDTIKQLVTYNNNQLISTKQYYFNGSKDEILTKNANGKIIRKSVCQIGSNGYAESSIDSSYNESGTFLNISVSTFEYQNGFLIKQTIDTTQCVYTYSISNDNIVSSNTSSPKYWPQGCTDNYSNGTDLTTIDVRNFKNKIFGKPGKNLITNAGWGNGCPCGPSSKNPSSYFEYEFNSRGYVTMMKEYYTPCHHDDEKSVTGTITTTIYEY